MTTVPRRAFTDYLGIGSLLACVAGVINAVGFVAFGGFVTHVSGNATRAAVEYSEGHFLIAIVFLVGIFFFISGSAITTLMLRGRPIDSPKMTYAYPLIFEALLISLVAWNGSTHLEIGQTLEISTLRDTWYLNTLTLAMGVQNAIIRQSSGLIIRTTHMTGNVTDIGIALGRVIHQIGLDLIKNPHSFLRKPKDLPTKDWIHRRLKSLYERFHLERFFLHVSLLFSFLLGAVLGTFGYLRVGFRVLTGPLCVLIVIAVLELIRWKKRTSAHGHPL